MNENIPQFDQIGQLQLRVISQNDTDIARLSRELPCRSLFEVYLLPKQGYCFTDADVQKMHFCQIQNVIEFYDPELSVAPLHATIKQMDLLQVFADKCLEFEHARFNYAVVRVPVGPVISIVFGDRRAMERVYKLGLRERSVQAVEDECSD